MTESIEAANVEYDEDILVSCRCESAKILSTLLSCLKYIGGGSADGADPQTSSRRRSVAAMQPVTVFCSPSRLNFHVHGKSKQMQASVEIPFGIFSDYDVCTTSNASSTDTEGEESHAGGDFCVNLTTVLECLHVLGNQNLDKTKLFFSYNLTKDIFKIELLDESGALCTAAIPGMLSLEDSLSDFLSVAFRSSPMAARIIVKSESLLGVMAELESVQGGTEVSVALSINGLELTVVGCWSECKVIIPARGNHVVSSTLSPSSNATNPPQQYHKYSLHAIAESLRGLDIASETCITLNDAGMAAIQHQVCVSTISEIRCFIDFILCCLNEDDDEYNHGDNDGILEQGALTPTNSRQEDYVTTAGCITRRRIVTNKKVSHKSIDDDNDENDDDQEEDENDDACSRYAASSETRLFGSVVAEDSVISRKLRRRTRRREVSAGQPDSPQSEELDFEDPPLDVTAPASPKHHDRHHDDCSSPELLYGQQN